MTVDIEIGGRRRRIRLERTARGWRADVDGQELTVDALVVPSGLSVLIGARSYDVSIRPRGPGEVSVHLSGSDFDARVVDPRTYRRRRPGHGGGGDAGARQVLAPMPGRVVKVLVKAGDRVSARQGLVVVEAMKMENELRALADGIVRDVRATEGASVEAGAVLLVLE